MTMETQAMKFPSNTFGQRARSMLAVDFRRMFTTRRFYILVGIALVIPILMLVMTTAVGGSATVDPATGVEAAGEMESFENTWQVVESLSGESSGGMDMMSMCNINLLFFLVAVFVCLFVGDDFRSGYAKNLFAVRSSKADYVISKTLTGFVAGACMILAYFIGALVGGSIAGLSFDPGTAGVSGIVLCLLAKICLMGVFVPIFVVMSVVGKQKLWISMVLSLGVGMLLFMMVPSLTPLDSTMMNVILCLAGGALFSVGLGAVSNVVLQKTNLI